MDGNIGELGKKVSAAGMGGTLPVLKEVGDAWTR